MLHSLEMLVEFMDGQWWIDAPWLKVPVIADTFQAAYDLAVAARHARTQKPR